MKIGDLHKSRAPNPFGDHRSDARVIAESHVGFPNAKGDDMNALILTVRCLTRQNRELRHKLESKNG